MNVVGFTPHADQRRVIDAIEKGEEKYFILTTGRQWGKTLLGMNLILKWALTKQNSMNMWVSPVFSQSKKVMEQLIMAIAGSPVVQSINKSDLEIKLINGSKIIFRSGEREDTLRGYTLDTLVVDEAAFLKENIWNQVLKQTVMVKGEKILFISTPKGKNFLYSLHIRGLDENQNQYRTLKGTSYDTPFISEQELIEAKKSLPEDIYRQEIMAEFIDSGGEVFKNLDLFCNLNQWNPPVQSKKYYGGIDFGRQNDYTVLSIFDEQGNLVFIYRERQKPWSVIVDDIVKHLSRYGATALAEVNSIGDVLFEQVKKKYPKVIPFTTTQATKQNIIEDLIYAMNENQISLPSKELYEPLYNELSTFSYDYNPKSRSVRYGAIDGAHDDIVMSIAIGYNALKSRRSSGSYKIY